MNVHIRWSKVSATRGGATVAALLRRRWDNEKQAHKVELNEWENEGGNLAPSPGTIDTLVTAGSA